MRRKVTAHFVQVGSIDDAVREQMFGLMSLCYDSVEPERFRADLSAKSAVILLRDRRTRAVVGFSTVRVDEERIGGRRALVVFSGDTVVRPDYWGAKQLQVRFLRYVAWLWLTHPRHRVFWLLLSKGYKTYLLLANYAAGSFPRYDGEATPALSRFLHHLAARRWPEAWVAEQGVLRWGAARDRVKPQVAPIDDELLRNPHVAFFVERNPGYRDGDELVCLAEARVRSLCFATVHLLSVRARTTMATFWPRGFRKAART